MAATLALWVIIWVISRGTSAFCPRREPVYHGWFLGGFSLLIQPFFEALVCSKDNPDYCGDAFHYSLMEMVFMLRARAHLMKHTLNLKMGPHYLHDFKLHMSRQFCE